MPKETGIIMTGDHPSKILRGEKTMTRRTRGLNEINKHPDLWEWFGYDNSGRYSFRSPRFNWHEILNIRCPYGRVGDRLWVKETFKVHQRSPDVVWYRADFQPFGRLSQEQAKSQWWRPARFMPRWASRITLEITGIRVERLQEITSEDCKLEGIPPHQMGNVIQEGYPVQKAFANLWDSINAKRGYSWEKNPWVWVIEFKLLNSCFGG